MTFDPARARFVGRLLTSGGDARIRFVPGREINRYGASPYPRAMRNYAASTANDISKPAFAHLLDIVARWPSGDALGADDYASGLERMRARLRAAYDLVPGTGIVFAPSGTDLEYVALHVARSRGGRALTNILLGSDEVGSGCPLAAQGRFFANETAVRAEVVKGATLDGCADVALVELPVRDAQGTALSRDKVAEHLDSAIRAARRAGRHALVHVVHGSKTGLILPGIDAIDTLRGRHGDAVTFVVDACQARIEPATVAAYLERACIVLMTGSKFMGGPPFSGFAFLPVAALAAMRRLPRGFGDIFRRAEWPAEWAGASGLEAAPNPGLLLRLEAALFELERFRALPRAQSLAVIDAFDAAVRALTQQLGVRLIVAPDGCPIESRTLATLDMSALPGAPDFATAQRWQNVLAARGIRLGQPVKCVRLPHGGWGATLRISLSMPMVVAMAQKDAGSVLATDMGRIADVLGAAARPLAA
jgi:hypothetical protein